MVTAKVSELVTVTLVGACGVVLSIRKGNKVILMHILAFIIKKVQEWLTNIHSLMNSLVIVYLVKI